MASYFHYTDIAALKSIIERKKLWFTDSRFLNDTSELKEGARIIQDNIDSIDVNKQPDEHSEGMFQLCAKAIKQYYIDNVFPVDIPAYVFSMSKNPNSLSQWRAYGQFAIEIDVDQLVDQGVEIAECIYDEDQKTQDASQRVTDHLINDVWYKYAELDPSEKIYPESLVYFHKLAMSYKSCGFRDEEEVRLYIIDKKKERDVQYRESGNLLLPYVKIDIPFSSIKSVTVGPSVQSALIVESLKLFLDTRVNEEQGTHSINTKTSDIPYRAG